MMCQEVIELMQRYLDQDLDEIEYNKMLKHLQDCTECTELFQRLLSVSEHLENLPKVTPSFSLVDAILPRLQHMDANPAATDYGVASAVTLSATYAAGQIEQSGAEQPGAQKKDAVAVTRLAGWRSRTSGLVSARIIGGVVAAGLVMGFFVFDQQKQSNMNNADTALMAPRSASQSKMADKEQAKADTSSSAMGAGSSDLMAPATAPPAEANPPASSTPDNNKWNQPLKEVVPPSNAPFVATPNKAATPGSTANMGSNKIGGSIPEGGASQGSTPSNSSIPSAPGQTGSTNSSQRVTTSVPAVGNGQLREPATFGAQQPSGTKTDATANVTPVVPLLTPSSSLATPSSIAPSAANGGSGGGASASAAAGSSLGELPKQGIVAPVSPTEGNMDTNKLKVGSGPIAEPTPPSTKMADTNSLASLDKQYTGNVIENRVIIKDKSGKTLFTSGRVGTESDKITLIAWSSDSKLTYQVSNQAGTRTYVINTINWTEANK